MQSLLLTRLVLLTIIAGMAHSAVPRHQSKQRLRKTHVNNPNNELIKDQAKISDNKAQFPLNNKVDVRETNEGVAASHLKLSNSINGNEKRKLIPTHFERLKRNYNNIQKKDTPYHINIKAKESKFVKAKQRTKRKLPQTKHKPESTTKKRVAQKKIPAVKEFPLNDIIYKGKSSNEANKFIRGNTKVGKPLELAYEYTREQDLNEIEERIQKRFIEYSNLKT